MVYYFTSNVVEPPATIYVGKDKFENEDLIKFGWEQDVWCVPGSLSLASYHGHDADHETVSALLRFHVDKLSSAHVYLRLRDGQTWDAIPQDLVVDLAQLTKANSIEGNKKDNMTVIYTPWSNLHKNNAMDVGQVSFKDQRIVKRVLVPQRENAIVNRLNKTKVEKKPDLQRERDDRLKELRRIEQEALTQRRKEEAKQAQEWKEKKWQKDHAYDDMFTDESMASSSNQDRGADWEDDFM
ncbi:Coiled-coil domain-containing protein 25 [Ophiocordyceps camponoti-floridani]|uniref:Coiled-coil domain-containing protein 25 n=1 Tax=Ophiocordyceps camponoti-floridani TaxID=2030778 RepID=A0A8H4Q0G2_9HYPO|nr:Coiled-coil domain-containing protein 25 [Ophiocordyceps camponoti-floridani]